MATLRSVRQTLGRTRAPGALPRCFSSDRLDRSVRQFSSFARPLGPALPTIARRCPEASPGEPRPVRYRARQMTITTARPCGTVPACCASSLLRTLDPAGSVPCAAGPSDHTRTCCSSRDSRRRELAWADCHQGCSSLASGALPSSMRPFWCARSISSHSSMRLPVRRCHC